MTQHQQQPEHWALDKRIPVAIIGTLLVQVVGFAWYAAKLDSRVEEQAARITKAESQILNIEREARDVSTRLVRVEEKMGAILDIVRRIERVVDGRSGQQ